MILICEKKSLAKVRLIPKEKSFYRMLSFYVKRTDTAEN